MQYERDYHVTYTWCKQILTLYICVCVCVCIYIFQSDSSETFANVRMIVPPNFRLTPGVTLPP